MIRFLTLVVFALCLVPIPVAAATRRVPLDYPTIQAAIDSAVSGDSILVGAGTYNENLDLQSKRLVLIGETGASATIVDGGQRGPVVLMRGGGVLEGFTLRNGRFQDGGGVYIDDNSAGTVIRNNVIEKNYAGFFLDSGRGGGIAVYYATSVLIEGNTLEDNHAGFQGGGFFELSPQGGVELRGNLIKANTSYVAGGGVRTNYANVIDNVIVNNVAGSGAAGVYSQGGLLESNTVVGNYNDTNAIHAAGIHATSGTIVRILSFTIRAGAARAPASCAAIVRCIVTTRGATTTLITSRLPTATLRGCVTSPRIHCSAMRRRATTGSRICHRARRWAAWAAGKLERARLGAA